MSSEADAYLGADAAYKASPPPDIGGLRLISQGPTLKFYSDDAYTILIAVRGTKPSDGSDLAAAAQLALGHLTASARYRRDKAELNTFFRAYPPSRYTFYITGHSLGGALVNQFKRDFPFIKAGTVFNGAFQLKDLIFQGSNIKRVYANTDPLYNAGGRFFRGSIVQKNSPAWGHPLSVFASRYKTNAGRSAQLADLLSANRAVAPPFDPAVEGTPEVAPGAALNENGAVGRNGAEGNRPLLGDPRGRLSEARGLGEAHLAALAWHASRPSGRKSLRRSHGRALRDARRRGWV